MPADWGSGVNLGLLTGKVKGYEKDVQLVNEVLAANGLPAHDEPTEAEFEFRADWGGSANSYLRLRKLAGAVRSGLRPSCWADVERDYPPAQEWLVEDPACHLLCHQELPTMGYYLPRDFPLPIPDERLDGKYLASSQGLLRDVLALADVLGLPLDPKTGHPTEAALQTCRDWSQHPTWSSVLDTWFTLYEAARISIRHGLLLRVE